MVDDTASIDILVNRQTPRGRHSGRDISIMRYSLSGALRRKPVPTPRQGVTRHRGEHRGGQDVAAPPRRRHLLYYTLNTGSDRNSYAMDPGIILFATPFVLREVGRRG